MGMTIEPGFPQVALPPGTGAAGGRAAAPGLFGGRKIAAVAEAGRARSDGIRQAVGQAQSSRSGLASVREALGLGVEGVDKATVDDLTRTDALGGIFKKAFDLKASQLDLGRFQG